MRTMRIWTKIIILEKWNTRSITGKEEQNDRNQNLQTKARCLSPLFRREIPCRSVVVAVLERHVWPFGVARLRLGFSRGVWGRLGLRFETWEWGWESEGICGFRVCERWEWDLGLRWFVFLILHNYYNAFFFF